jgi:hypothetical protein
VPEAVVEREESCVVPSGNCVVAGEEEEDEEANNGFTYTSTFFPRPIVE